MTGDVQKEAHMAFCLGQVEFDKDHFLSALKFFKRFFFCARLLDDPVGAALALNRLAVCFHKLGRYEKSLVIHKKHLACTDQENAFASLYNIGISYRTMGRAEPSIRYF